jgi:putative ABC transport system permease protein
MSVIWSKVWHDLAHNRARTLLAVLSTAVGVFTLGLAFGAAGVIPARLVEAYRATAPAHVTVWGGPFDREAVEAAEREPGVAGAEGEIAARLRWKHASEARWRDGMLIARDDYAGQHMNLVRRLAGSWPDDRVLAVERLSAEHYTIPLDSSVLVEWRQRERSVPVEGVLRAEVEDPPQWGGDAMFFATPETAAWLTGEGEDFNRIHARLESFSRRDAREAARGIQRRLERMGLPVEGYTVNDPSIHPMQDMVSATLIVLLVMGMLSLGLSAFLIINTMNALVAQQVWQIGVMKAVGATFGQVARVYLAAALAYGALALLLAVPLGAVATYLMSAALLDMFNVELTGFQVQPGALALQVGVGVAAPLIAAGIPVVSGARATARQAMSSRGLGGGFGHGPLDRLVGRVRFLPRPLTLSLRNTFRRKARVTLTLLALTLSGVMFIMVMSVGDSFWETVDHMFLQLGQEVSVSLEQPEHAERLAEIAREVPGVAAVEVWSLWPAAVSVPAGAQGVAADGEEQPVVVWGVPPDSTMFAPRLLAGRRLLPGDDRAVLVNKRLAEDESIRVGDEITLSIEGEESEWAVAGVVASFSSIQDDFFVPLGALARETGTVNRGTQVLVTSESHDPAAPRRLADDLAAAFTARRIRVAGAWNVSDQRQESQAAFGTLTYLLLSMSLLIAAVGGIGLAGTMSINVVERAREIGVMRAIGATSAAIGGIFVAEGTLVGLLSWLLAVPLSYPGARLFSDMIGDAVINYPLDFVYSTRAAVLWLLLVLILSALASLWPALRAARISVREALAYE